MAEGNIPLVARIMVQHGGAGSGATGIGDARRQQSTQKNMQQTAEKSTAIQGTSLLKMGGMLAGIGLLVGFTIKMFKNSQVTKSIFGAVFQILGAMMDMLLMPLLPLIVPLLQKMAGWLPKVAEFGQRVAVHVKKFIDIWEKQGWKDAMVFAWETVAQPIFDHIVEAVVAGIKALVPTKEDLIESSAKGIINYSTGGRVDVTNSTPTPNMVGGSMGIHVTAPTYGQTININLTGAANGTETHSVKSTNTIKQETVEFDLLGTLLGYIIYGGYR
tara:strand:- start:24430 stop:25248 length:819 start_codon:yes stop_codon:yes gene_type:complete